MYEVVPVTTRSIEVMPMSQKHIDSVVAIHMASFPDYFSTSLGGRYIQVVYEEILKWPEHVAFVVLDRSSGEVVGFINGFTRQTRFYSHMARKRWLNVAVACMGAVLSRPTIVLRLFRALRYPQKSREASAEALLLSVAVLPASSGYGVGRALVEAFLQEMKERDVPAVCLTTDRENNERTNRFYQKLGFSIARTFTTAEGRAINEYLIELSESN